MRLLFQLATSTMLAVGTIVDIWERARILREVMDTGTAVSMWNTSGPDCLQRPWPVSTLGDLPAAWGLLDPFHCC